MRRIARIYTDFGENFGIPRQSGLAEALRGEIIFEKDFRNDHAVRGLEEFTHIWVLWKFDLPEAPAESGGGGGEEARVFDAPGALKWRPTVRPPRLGGNVRMGVFATRSPFRPNPIGLSCVRLDCVRIDKERGPVLSVSGIDMRNGTEIYDIKLYLPHIDARPEARGGFSETAAVHRLRVDFPDGLLRKLPLELREGAVQMLSQDPRPGYQRSSERVYGVTFGGYNICFQVKDDCLTVTDLGTHPSG